MTTIVIFRADTRSSITTSTATCVANDGIVKRLGLVGVVVILTCVSAADAQQSTCDPTPLSNGAYLQPVISGCTPDQFPAALDAPQLVQNGTLTADDYVLSADLARDDDPSTELMLLIKPWSLETEFATIVLARVYRDGQIDGHTYHDVVPAANN